MKKTIIIGLIVVILAVIFAIQNSGKVEIFFYFWKHEIPLALLIIITLAIGTLLGILVSLPSIRKKQVSADSKKDTDPKF